MKLKRILITLGLLVSTAYAQKYVEYTLPIEGEDVVGQLTYVVPKKHESLVDLTMRYEMGYEELRWANPGINAWLLSDTQPLVLPTEFILPEGKRSGLVSNIPEMRTYYYLKDSDKVYVYPVGVGRMDWKTPLGSWSITRKQEHPNWYPPESIRREHQEMGRGTLPSMVPAGPDNPLGTRVLRLALPSYLLHGTNEQTGIGMRVTHGCMRFYPQHIEHLYDMVPTNTMVTFLNQPVKYGVQGNDILIEVHPPLEEDNLSTEALKTKAFAQLTEYLKQFPNASVNHDMVNIAVQQQTGIPIIVGQKDSRIGIEQLGATQITPAPIDMPKPFDSPKAIDTPKQIDTRTADITAPAQLAPIEMMGEPSTQAKTLPSNPEHLSYEDMNPNAVVTQPKVSVTTRDVKTPAKNATQPRFSQYAEPSQGEVIAPSNEAVAPASGTVQFPDSETERAYQEQARGPAINTITRPNAQ